ncbi:WSC-domain-containing protein [Xylariomycetidae sp. FL2044]|nr:WSC-domain-containing protein [Xylariomycetidae sp. FL2044]
MRSLTSPFLLTALAALAHAAANFEGKPDVGLQVGNYKYLGCAFEIPGRALVGMSYSDDKMTIESCQTYCRQNNFPLVGLEAGRECFCGKRIASPAVVSPDATCDMSCGGNQKQNCGGWGKVSLFQSTDFSGPAPPKSIAGTQWQYQSCYMEPMSPRALQTLIKADDKMTVEMCTKACGDAAYAYAGLEYGRECWCGQQPAPGLEDASDPSCAMQCDMPCGGNAAQICGGRGAITIYRNGGGNANSQSNASGGGGMGNGNGNSKSMRDLRVDELRARKGRFFRVRKSSRNAGPQGSS